MTSIFPPSEAEHAETHNHRFVADDETFAPMQSHLSTEDLDALGYPQPPAGCFDAEKIKEELNDPRLNPNLLLDVNDQEFWNNAARKPYAKAALRSEQHWNDRRSAWLAQQDTIAIMNKSRNEIMGLLEDCSMEVKRLVTPMLRYKMMETMLWNFDREAKDCGIPLATFLEHSEQLQLLRKLRARIDFGGGEMAEQLIEEFETRAHQHIVDDLEGKARERPDRMVLDSDTLVKSLNMGTKYKKDGLLEWQNSNYAEALASWRLADEMLRLLKAPPRDKEGNRLIAELHSSVLKNLAQAAIKLERWTEALAAADDALALDSGDHKAWFRRACALEGLGQLEKVEDALSKIDEIVVGRADCTRIQKDTQAKRAKLQLLQQRQRAIEKRGLDRALQQGIFSENRDALPESKKMQDLKPNAMPASVQKQLDHTSRKRLTKDGAEELLSALNSVYSDTGFRKRVEKLKVDVRGNKIEFMRHMGKVALEVQRPVLERWGFEASPAGVKEMQLAVQDHTKGERCDMALKEQAEAVTRTLYGDMYGALFDT